MLGAIVLALSGAGLAVIVFPLMRQSDALLRDGVRVAATVVAVEETTCRRSNTRNREPFPCFTVTGKWIHDGVSYRTVVGQFEQRHQWPVGATMTLVFAPDPAAAAGKADLRFRVINRGETEPRSERPVYLGLLVLAGLMWIPAVTLLFRGTARFTRETSRT